LGVIEAAVIEEESMRTKLSLIAVALWLASLLSPVMNESGTNQPGYYVLLISLWGAIYLWTLPWVFLNLAFFIILRNNLRAKAKRDLIEVFFLVLTLVTLIEIASEVFVRSSGIEPAGIWRYGAVVWTLAMVLMGFVGLSLKAKDEEMKIADEQMPPNNRMHRSAASEVRMISPIQLAAPGDAGR
jgi:hypothetical protein